MIDERWSNKEFVMEQVKKDGGKLVFASNELRNDPEVVLTAVHAKQEGGVMAFQSASNNMKANRAVVLEAVQVDGICIEQASKELQNDKELAILAVAQDGRNYSSLNEKMRNELDVAKVAVLSNGNAIHYVGDQLKGNDELVLSAFLKSGNLNDLTTFLTAEKQNELVEMLKKHIKEILPEPTKLAFEAENGYKYAVKKLDNGYEFAIFDSEYKEMKNGLFNFDESSIYRALDKYVMYLTPWGRTEDSHIVDAYDLCEDTKGESMKEISYDALMIVAKAKKEEVKETSMLATIKSKGTSTEKTDDEPSKSKEQER